MSEPRNRHEGAVVVSARTARGQLILCQGCCCGRTDRGFPEVPIDRMKAAWKAGRLNRTVQLTISGCVGPCDVANVAVVVTPRGTEWYGRLDPGHYDALIAWAESSHAVASLLPVPFGVRARRFEWFVSEPQPGIPPACQLESTRAHAEAGANPEEEP